ncbi:MAG: hypothetical protein PHI27_03000 [Eubacteriales bacterium]|nr:hypothetical protein [Eubacteriales bacterium]MDD3881203.1 hypothetical protein [Eubacteriales bacterium]MDD4511585.1 hypothetical protein [Eubacteriales bacterium]
MSNINQPVTPEIGPEGLPTPSLPGGEPAAPGTGPEELPTPSLPGPVVDYSCPSGYTAKTAGANRTLTDLLLENDVSYSAMLSANPSLSLGRIRQGTRYCAPPAGTRRVCRFGSASYVMGIGEDLSTLMETNGYTARELLLLNPMLAPSDFTSGRVICVPL